MEVSPAQWIYYDPDIGVEGLTATGLPGQGKDNLVREMVLECVRSKNESWVVPGDRFCQWRHFTLFPSVINGLVVVVPEGVDITYHGKGLEKLRGNFVVTDYKTLDVMDYLPDDGLSRMLVVYDQHLPIDDRTWLWVDICDRLCNRITMLDRPIGVMFSEAGIYFPQESEGEQWKAILQYSKLFVDFRKGLVRTVFISQLPSQVKSTIRNNCMFSIRKRGIADKNDDPKVRKKVPFLKRNKYAFLNGGLYNLHCSNDKSHEVTEEWRMIPPYIPRKKDKQDNQDYKVIKKGKKIYIQRQDTEGKFNGKMINITEQVRELVEV